MNSVVQVLKTCKEFKEGLVASSSASSGGFGGAVSDAQFTQGMRQFLNELEGTTETVTPYQFVTLLRTRFPQFGQTTGNPPSYQQQDLQTAIRDKVVTRN